LKRKNNKTLRLKVQSLEKSIWKVYYTQIVDNLLHENETLSKVIFMIAEEDNELIS